jgi:DNA-binding response OmpR family regulator
MRILIIDDEIEVADLLAEAVRFAGHESMVGHNGVRSLRLLGQERPDPCSWTW